ncbi:zinc finger protein 414 isoform X2 [Pleurodeles waltl]|uniref:zinc finger protein 414 isoform X2 n=1 Tax=Pleurodeles waltl TaxID=8319 RepID=UPI0037095728
MTSVKRSAPCGLTEGPCKRRTGGHLGVAPYGKQFKCSTHGCQLAFNNMQQLLQHSRVHSKPIQSLAGKLFHCSTLGCKEVLPSMQELLTHQKTHYKPNRYFKCENCMVRFRSHRSLFKHLHVCFDVSTRPSTQRMEKSKLDSADGLEASVKPLLLEGLPKMQSVIIHPEKKAILPSSGAVTTTTSTTVTSLHPASSLDNVLPIIQNDTPEIESKLSSSPMNSPMPQTFSPLESSMFGSSTLPQLCGEAHSPTSERFISYGQPSPHNSSQTVSNATRKKNQGYSTNSRIVWEHTRGRYSCMQCPFSTTMRDEMTRHVKDHKNQPSRLQSEIDCSEPLLSPLHSKLAPDLENPVYSQT